MWAGCCCRVALGGAPPIITSIEPPRGPDAGLYQIEIRGRNLAFLDADCQVYVNEVKMDERKTFVRDPWDRMVTTITACPRCGEVDVYVACGGVPSNKLAFSMDNDCYGPLPPGKVPLIPKPFSAKENCTICETLVHMTIATAPEMASYQALQASMGQACYTIHFKKYGIPGCGATCEAAYDDACRLMVASEGDNLVDNIWAEWDGYYWVGALPRKVCEIAQKCQDVLLMAETESALGAHDNSVITEGPGMNGLDYADFSGGVRPNDYNNKTFPGNTRGEVEQRSP